MLPLVNFSAINQYYPSKPLKIYSTSSSTSQSHKHSLILHYEIPLNFLLKIGGQKTKHYFTFGVDMTIGLYCGCRRWRKRLSGWQEVKLRHMMKAVRAALITWEDDKKMQVKQMPDLSGSPLSSKVSSCQVGFLSLSLFCYISF